MTRNLIASRIALGACAGVLTLCAGCAGPTTSTSTDGVTLVSDLCGRCHPVSRVDGAAKDRSGWEATVDRMAANGLRMTAVQRGAIIDYLTKRDGGR